MRIKREIIFSFSCFPRRVTPRAHASGHKEPSSCQVWRLAIRIGGRQPLSRSTSAAADSTRLVCISLFYWSPWLIFSNVWCVLDRKARKALAWDTGRADALTPVRWFQFIRGEFQTSKRFAAPSLLRVYATAPAPLSHTLLFSSHTSHNPLPPRGIPRAPLFLLDAFAHRLRCSCNITRLEDRLWPRFRVASSKKRWIGSLC